MTAVMSVSDIRDSNKKQLLSKSERGRYILSDNLRGELGQRAFRKWMAYREDPRSQSHQPAII